MSPPGLYGETGVMLTPWNMVTRQTKLIPYLFDLF